MSQTQTKKHRKVFIKKKRIAPVRKVRLAIECSPQERKYMKMVAAHEEKTLSEFVLESVRIRMKKCSQSHVPNKETQAALKDVQENKDLIEFNSIEDFFKSLEG